MYTVNETYKNIEAEFKPRSKWGHGVKDTALALLDSLDMPETVLPDHFWSRHALLLNGADNWREYSHAHQSPLIIHVLLWRWNMSPRVADCLITPHVIYYIYQANGLSL